MSKKDANPVEEVATEPVEVPEAPLNPTKELAKKSRFWALYEEAMEDDVVSEPYPFDYDPDNVIYIPKPETTDQVLSLASIIDSDGDVAIEEVKPMLKAFLGDYYDKVYTKTLARYKLPVTLAIVSDMNDFWFSRELREQAQAMPGGTAGSSS